MDYTNIIGEKIKSLRNIKEISIEELAENTGLLNKSHALKKISIFRRWHR